MRALCGASVESMGDFVGVGVVSFEAAAAQGNRRIGRH